MLGGIGIAIMLNPWDFGYGITFDTRSVLLCTSGLFFGTLPVSIAVAITAGFRLLMGGSGTLTGVAVIATSGAIGLSWRHFRKDALSEPSMAQLYLFGIVVHLTMLVCMVLLPRQMIYSVFREISLPVMVIYPVATAVLGNLMVRRTRRSRVEQALSHSHELMRYIIENVNSAVAVHDRDLKYLYVSRRYLKDYNVEERDVIGRHHYDVFPDLPDKWRKAHQKALKGEVTGALRDPFLCAGTEAWNGPAGSAGPGMKPTGISGG
jgi:PAS domain-containing protein